MIDSWMPRKLDPGFAAMYSRFSDLSTSTMKSPPGRSVVRTSTSGEGSASGRAIGAVAGAAAAGAAACCCCASGRAVLPTSAAPVTAALFRKSRRGTDPFCDIGLYPFLALVQRGDGPRAARQRNENHDPPDTDTPAR